GDLTDRIAEAVARKRDCLDASEAKAATLQAADAHRRECEEDARDTRSEADALTNEVATLSRLLATADAGDGAKAVDLITVADGFEKALAAALGDDLDAAVGREAATYWRTLPDADDIHAGDPDLPQGAASLAERLEAPPELKRRLRQIGIVAPDRGAGLQAQLKPGQVLISEAGDLWRWDGLVATAAAPSPAAVRLAERNRLQALRPKADAAKRAAEATSQKLARANDALAKAKQDASSADAALADCTATLDDLQAADMAGREARLKWSSRMETLVDLIARAETDRAETTDRVAESEAALAGLPAEDHLDAPLSDATDAVAAAQTVVTEARAALISLTVRAEARQAQLDTAHADDARWQQRIENGEAQIKRLGARTEAVAEQLVTARTVPGQITQRQDALATTIDETETNRKASADKLAEAETALRTATAALKRAQETVSETREMKARTETRLEAARTLLIGTVQQIADTFDGATPDTCLGLSDLKPEGPSDGQAEHPSIEDADRRLQKLRSDRDRLGGVNLQATEELDTLQAEFDTLDRERADVDEAIQKLRNAIAQLNREGRKRLQDAFTSVNRQFSNLFRTLFNGGEAHLEMIEADDPLEGGLEIVAKPPGKKPTTLSLLSGGEQTLTALSLIFAVFLTNPSPICVLDEVDAPLDDANVDRFCTLMESMAQKTDTRFLVITHHPMTMSRVDRLFGVTMAERGVSQLVSVDLTTAEEFLEAS
ncbi:MAG: chromosome segregation protein SMC, partial [Pseudomonadota bacterium]